MKYETGNKMTVTTLQGYIDQFVKSNGKNPDYIILSKDDFEIVEREIFGFQDPTVEQVKFNGIDVYKYPGPEIKEVLA